MRIVLIVIDSGGIGAAPDAAQFGDEGANTLGHVAAAEPTLSLPHLAAMGLNRLVFLPTDDQVPLRGVAYAMIPQARGKDTLAGHWEMMGITIDKPFETFSEGFPDSVLALVESVIQRPILGNEVASGTEIIERLGEVHRQTGFPIVYTSADSVLQIAAHEDVIPPKMLYQWCGDLRQSLDKSSYRIGRVIARPFIGEQGGYVRTPRRHDFTIRPPGPTVLNGLLQAGIETIAIGKIGDIFSQQGLSQHRVTQSNLDGLQITLETLRKAKSDTFIFTNLVEFDSHYGHRRNPSGYAQALREVDGFLPGLWNALEADDQLWITADHGCDPTFKGTDHTRERVPWLAYGPGLKPRMGAARIGLGDIGATLAALWKVPYPFPGVAAKELIIRK
jgi:phosphopentomutase